MSTSDGMRAALSWLATYGVHSTLFLGSAWALCRFRPPRAERNRERIWKLALVGGVLSATLQLALGARPLLGRIDWNTEPRAELARAGGEPAAEGVLPAPKSAPASAAAIPVQEHTPRPLRLASSPPDSPARGFNATPRAVSPAPRGTETLLPSPSGPETGSESGAQAPLEERAGTHEPARGASAAAVLEAEATEGPGAAPERGTPGPLAARIATLTDGLRTRAEAWRGRWPGVVLLGWILVGCAGLLAMLASWSGLRRRMLGRRILRDGPLVEALARLQARAGIARRVRLSVSTRITSPFSTGILWPEVCVPAAVRTDLTRAQQEALLAHELAHIVRRDPAWFGLGYLIERVLFFQPLNRLARRQLAELAEVACDDAAVRWTGARLALASCLAEVAGWVIGEPRARFVPPGLSGQGSRLRQRVERLLDDRRSPAGEPPAPWWPPLTVVALGLVTLAVPGVAAGKAEPLPDEVPSAPPSPGLAAVLAELAADAEGAPTVPALEPVLPEAESGGWLDLEVERGVIQAELALLEAELGALNAELESRALRGRFADALRRVAERMEVLRAQQRRVSALLARLSPTPNAPNTPAPPAPTAHAPDSNRADPNDRPGDPR